MQVYPPDPHIKSVVSSFTQVSTQQSPPSQPHSNVFTSSSHHPSPQNEAGAQAGFSLQTVVLGGTTTTGALEGALDGLGEGAFEGTGDGFAEGALDGVFEGAIDGRADGVMVGRPGRTVITGLDEGITLGDDDGVEEGLADGALFNAMGSTQDGNGPLHLRPFNTPHVDSQQSPSS